MAKKKPQRSLIKWTQQKWRTKSGKPSTEGPDATGEAYAPEAAIRSMPDKKYARATAVKRAARKKGVQHAKHGLHKGKKR